MKPACSDAVFIGLTLNTKKIINFELIKISKFYLALFAIDYLLEIIIKWLILTSWENVRPLLIFGGKSRPFQYYRFLSKLEFHW